LYFLSKSHLYFTVFLSYILLQTSDESDDLGESAQDKKPEVIQRTDQPEADSSRVEKPPLRKYEIFLMSLKAVSSLPSNFSSFANIVVEQRKICDTRNWQVK